jgi:DNA-directed RNA polymerase subunit RPC12/RpoP
MTNKICGRCGKENAGEDEVYCPDCKSDIGRKKRKRLWYSGVAAVILLLAGTFFLYVEKNVCEFSWNSLLRRPAAVINGDPIAWSEARERFRITRLMMEKEYGKELFAGEKGGAYLRDLERDILERMVSERLVAQEARRMNIKIADDKVLQEMQNIGREIYGNWENFQTSLKEDGISEEYLSAHVRNLLLRQEVKKAKAPAGADPDEVFGAWLAQDRQGAKITLYRNVGLSQVSSQGQGSCCGSGGLAVGSGCGGRGGGGCGGKQVAVGPLDPQLKAEASGAALAAYRKTNPAEKDVVVAQVTDYGCHVQVDIAKGSRVVKSYSYQDGQAFEN